jgi:lysophospholipase L1-like esterase
MSLPASAHAHRNPEPDAVEGQRRAPRFAHIPAIAVTLSAFAVGLALGEITVRLTRPRITPDVERAVSLEYAPSVLSRHVLLPEEKETRTWNGTLWYRINSRGYRGREFAVPKPEGVVRIVVLGGSAAFDINAKEGQDWPRLVETALRQAGHGEVEVINAATPGHATWDALGRLYGEIWMIEPDYVLVYEAWNDVKYFSWLHPERSLQRGFEPAPAVRQEDTLKVANPFIYYTNALDRVLSYSQFYTHLRRRYWRWQSGEIGLEGLLTAPPNQVDEAYPDTFAPWGPRQYELNLRLIVDATRDMGATPILLTQARLPVDADDTVNQERTRLAYARLSYRGLIRAFEACDAAVNSAAAAEHVQVIDPSSVLSGQRELFTDQVHTTALGSRALAELVASELQPALASAAPPGDTDEQRVAAAETAR